MTIRPPRSLELVVWLAMLAASAAVGYSLWCRTPLIWDGAYQLAYMLRTGEVYQYLTRYHTFFLWQPTVWAMHYTGDVRLLQAVYGGPFLLAPVVGLGLSWWFVRRRQPGLIVWAALGTLLTPLPGQIFVINDSIFQQHLFWPVFVGLFVPLNWRQRIAWLMCLVFQFAHQVAIVHWAATTVAAGLLILLSRDPADRRRFVGAFFVALVCLLGIAAKIYITSRPDNRFYDSYAAQEATWEHAQRCWWAAVSKWPIRGLRFCYLAGGFLLLNAFFRSRGRATWARWAAVLAFVSLAWTAWIWFDWSLKSERWQGAIDYRRWVVPLTAPAFFLAFFEIAWRARAIDPRRLPSPGAARCLLLLLAGAIFTVVLGNQSRQYDAFVRRFETEMQQSSRATIVVGKDHWARNSPLAHWGLSFEALILQDKAPSHWAMMTVEIPKVTPPLLPDGSAGPDGRFGLDVLKQDPPLLPMTKWDVLPAEPGPFGWFDLRNLLPAAAKEFRETEE